MFFREIISMRPVSTNVAHARSSDVIAPSGGDRVDILSQLLNLVRLRGERVFAAELTAPWGLSYEAGLSYFHAVTEGRATIHSPGQAPMPLNTGDLVLVTHGEGHWIEDEDGTPVAAQDLLAERSEADRLSFRHGGHGRAAKVITERFVLIPAPHRPLLPTCLRSCA